MGLREDADKRIKDLKQHRLSFESRVMDISDFFMPRRSRFISSMRNDGSKKASKIVNDTPTYALKTLSSGMMSGLTSPARPWFKLETPDPALTERSAVKQWLEVVELRINTVFSRSNFYKALPTIYKEMAGFGTGAMIIVEDFNTVIRCYPFTFGEYWIALDESLKVNTLYRETEFTVGQLASKFGKDNLSDTVLKLYNDGKFDSWIPVTHGMEPNELRKPQYKDNQNMPYNSFYYETGANDEYCF